MENTNKAIIEYVSSRGHKNVEVPILMDRDIQDGIFIDDKIFKAGRKSLRYDLTLPLFVHMSNIEKKGCYHIH